MEKIGEKMGEKMIFVGVWLEGWKEKKMLGPMVLSLWAHQKLISLIGGGKELNGKWLIYSYCAHVSLTWLAFIYYFKTLMLTIHASYYFTMNKLFCFFFFFYYFLFFIFYFFIKRQYFKLLLFIFLFLDLLLVVLVCSN